MGAKFSDLFSATFFKILLSCQVLPQTVYSSSEDIPIDVFVVDRACDFMFIKV